MKVLTTLATSSVPPGLRGALNQWMLEVLPGIFVGRISARIRTELWRALTDALVEAGAYAALIVQDESEQGFHIESFGPHRYQVHDHGGVQLVTVRHDRRPSVEGAAEGLPDPSW